MKIHAILVALSLLPVLADAACHVSSGPMTTPLVELYTSEGCSSCPPADAYLRQMDPQAVAMELHVGYWDYIGWKDRFAQPAFAERQKWLVRVNGHRTVYTPHFFVSGKEAGSRPGQVEALITRIHATPSQAHIELAARLAADGRLQVDGKASALTSDASLYLAVVEDGLSSDVSDGENSGHILHHDKVVRSWIGPIPMTGHTTRINREVSLSPAWIRPHLSLVAFVQDPHDGAVLQAVKAERCIAPHDISSGL